jgi:hypothetical protein
LKAALPAYGKKDSRWLRFGVRRGLRQRVFESSWWKDTLRAIEPEFYGADGEPKDSVDQDTTLQIISNDLQAIVKQCKYSRRSTP